MPDETTLCKFRHLLEEHGLNKLFFDAINRVMEEPGHIMKGGTIVDTTIIDAPSSTRNAEKKRDPEMHSTKKGNQESICQGGFHLKVFTDHNECNMHECNMQYNEYTV